MLKTQEEAQITWQKRVFLDHYLSPPGLHLGTQPWHCPSRVLWQQRGHPALPCHQPVPAPTAPPALCWLCLTREMPDSGDRASVERGACFGAGLSTSVNLWLYQLCASHSFAPDGWQSIPGSPLSVTASGPEHGRLDTRQTLLRTEINLQNHAELLLSVYSSQAQRNYRLHQTWETFFSFSISCTSFTFTLEDE